MRRTALVTGASSGIGWQIAKQLNNRGYDLIITARRKDKLEELKCQLKGKVTVITADLSKREECFRLYDMVADKNISVLANNAGFGLIGDFNQTDLDRELEMLDVNCSATHILTKLFLRDFQKKNRGYILNVASSAGLMLGGPYMATYYATKSYVVNLTSAINEELRRQGSGVKISALCPGPVDTEFNSVAGCKFGIKSITAEFCAKSAIDGLFSGKMIIIPEKVMKLSNFATRFGSRRLILALTSHFQSKKLG